MNFASFPYLVFLMLCVALYFSLGRPRMVFLLLVSYLFYAFFGLGFVALMVFTTSVTYVSALACHKASSKENRLFFLWFGLLIDLGVFVLFKYMHIIDVDLMNWPGWGVQKLLIPVGISFYTFKTVGYCVDVYKGKYAPERSFVHYAASVSFFPQLIAGPIERSHELARQFKKNVPFRIEDLSAGAKLILWGLFKKLVIADSIAQVIDPVFANPRHYGGADLLIALFAFVYQVYTDFSGYSDIAIGSAKCFGIDLPANFNKPLFSRNLFDFWRRWHITFYKWFKEYVYDNLFPSGRGKYKAVIVFRATIVFALVGLWHGASMNYFLYAMTALVWVLLDSATRSLRLKLFFPLRKQKWLLRALSYLANTAMVASICIFFRPGSLEDSFYVASHLIDFDVTVLSRLQVLFLAAVIIFFELLQVGQLHARGTCFDRVRNFYVRGSLYVAMMFLLILISSRPDVTFQYFQF